MKTVKTVPYYVRSTNKETETLYWSLLYQLCKTYCFLAAVCAPTSVQTVQLEDGGKGEVSTEKYMQAETRLWYTYRNA